MKIKDYEFENERTGLSYHCPACGHHVVTLTGNPKWNFNGDYNSPTLTPSVHITIYKGSEKAVDSICHHYITDGNIKFLGDCTHSLRGQTIPLPEILI